MSAGPIDTSATPAATTPNPVTPESASPPATRRQFARLGFGELADFMPDADSHESTAEAARRMAEANAGEPVKKGLGIDVTKP